MSRPWRAWAIPALLATGCVVGGQQPASEAASKRAARAPVAQVAVAPLPAQAQAPSAPEAAATDASPAQVTAQATSWTTGGKNPPAREPDPPFAEAEFARFNEPWAMTFLPDGRLLVTEKAGRLRLFNPVNRATTEVTGVPAVAYGGQGGLGDVVLHPQFASNRLVYLSYAESGASGTYGAVVARAQLQLDGGGNGGTLAAPQVVWRQSPKVSGQGHYSHRIAFDGAGKLWVTAGDRQKMDPAQDLQQSLGKVLRLNDDGSVPADNPFAAQGGVASQVWSYGHRNLLGIAFDGAGRLWTHEMGPEGGDELNLIERGSNYGWPLVSNGSHYGGGPIPDHNPGVDGFNAPEAWWTPVIAPAGFVIYSGDLFPFFRGEGFIGGLASQSLVRIRFDGVQASEYRRYAMGSRIREVEQGPDGALWLLDDGGNARLRKLTPRPY